MSTISGISIRTAAMLVLITAVPAAAEAEGAAANDAASTCQQMLDKVKLMIDKMTDTARISMAQHQMNSAQEAQDAGNPDACITILRKVVGTTQSDADR